MSRGAPRKENPAVHCSSTGEDLCPRHPWSPRFASGQCKMCKKEYAERRRREYVADPNKVCKYGHVGAYNRHGNCETCQSEQYRSRTPEQKERVRQYSKEYWRKKRAEPEQEKIRADALALPPLFDD